MILSQSESFIFGIQLFSRFGGFFGALPNFSSENSGNEGKNNRFVSGGCSLEEFVQHQENKSASSKTQSDRY